MFSGSHLLFSSSFLPYNVILKKQQLVLLLRQGRKLQHSMRHHTEHKLEQVHTYYFNLGKCLRSLHWHRSFSALVLSFRCIICSNLRAMQYISLQQLKSTSKYVAEQATNICVQPCYHYCEGPRISRVESIIMYKWEWWNGIIRIIRMIIKLLLHLHTTARTTLDLNISRRAGRENSVTD